MLKKNLKRILIIILFIICMGISSFATSYLLNATQVSYGSGSVKTALDDLYAKANTLQSTAGFGPVNHDQIANFGKTVTGSSVPEQGGVWRIFYADSEYIYLLRDSIGDYALNNTSIVKGWNSSTPTPLAGLLNKKFTLSSGTIWSDKSGNNNIKAVSALLDASKWTDYKSADAVWAIGAPTVEMFVASYNATHDKAHYSSFGVSNIQIACHYDSTTDSGYKVSINGESQANNITGLGNTANFLDDKIYCPSSGKWWLASPFDGHPEWVGFVDSHDGGELGYRYYANGGCVRPLVAIPISKIGNGITIGSL